ncbi:peptidoglycan-binding protein [Rhizobium sp. BK176]|uniref:peptidoglycan-binding domain-containing protein n=1 Tax=Rhizobium sp. BK176 TaxID=2587071 RepID=UPI00216818EF|nr:peptidoglycan-binding domain-containing protein [Rhizobium sp. BK176]
MSTLKLQPGDVGVFVRMVEDALSKLGYFASPPDDIYTDETARGAAAFQRAASLPETGTIDIATWKKLSLAAVVGEGGRC